MKIQPKAEYGIVSRLAENRLFAYQGWPTVIRTKDGVLYVGSSSFRMAHVCPFGKTALYVSRDEGKTWTRPIVVNDTLLDDRDVGLCEGKDGQILLTWFTHHTETYTGNYREHIHEHAGPIGDAMLSLYPGFGPNENRGGSYVRVSFDKGLTWGETVRVPVSAPHGPCILEDGSFLYLGKEFNSECGEQHEVHEKIAAWKGTSDGKIWTRLGSCDMPEGMDVNNFHEPHALQLPDGSILGVIRAEGMDQYPEIKHGFTVMQTRSYDGGKTWTPWKDTGMNGSPAHLLMDSSGDLICSVGRREVPCGEVAYVSHDKGETWDEEYELDMRSPNNGDLGYPSTCELSDGSFLTVYYQRLPGDDFTSILYTRWVK